MYSHRLTIATPATMIELANRIARSSDPDYEGHKSFAGVRATDPDGNEYVICDTWVREAFAQQAGAMLANPALLHAACAADYAARWPDLTAPTLAECSQFVTMSAIHIEARSERTVGDVLGPLGLEMVPNALTQAQ